MTVGVGVSMTVGDVVVVGVVVVSDNACIVGSLPLIRLSGCISGCT